MGIQNRAGRYHTGQYGPVTHFIEGGTLAVNPLFRGHDWRAILGWMAAAIMLVRAVLPMSMMTPSGLSEIVICGGHGVETILVDQDMNRVNPDAPSAGDAEHCGLCTLVFGLAWAIALTWGMACLILPAPPRRNDIWRALRLVFNPALARAPPAFS